MRGQGFSNRRAGERAPNAARSGAMLKYIDTETPGITRRRRGRYWQYFDADGARVTDRAEIDRLNRLGVPPAYRDVWYCPHAHGHLQAIGIDARGRKQYRYHDEFRSAREADKYDRCAKFGTALPKIRARVEEDLNERGMGKERIVAAIVRLLDVGHIRVGNEGYAAENDSYGATTLRNKHGEVKGNTVRLEYRGKSGKMQKVAVKDATLARLVQRCQDLPGQHLFQYIGEDGEPRPVGSADVNAYLREATDDEFTAKHFRTWGASVIAFETILDRKDSGLTMKELLQPVADALGNTPAISRKSYVHPLLLEAVKTGELDLLRGGRLPRPTRYLSAAERGLIDLLDASEGLKAAA